MTTYYLGSKRWKPAVLQDLVLLQRGFDITKAEQKDGEVQVISSSGPSSWHNQAMVQGPGVVIGRKGSLGTVHYSEGDFWPHDTTLWSKSLNGNNPRGHLAFLKERTRFTGQFYETAAAPLTAS